MKNTHPKRTKWLHIRLSESELSELQQRCQRTTCRKLSDYARRILLHQRITTYTRNQSMDAFLAELVLLRRGLQSACEDFHQMVEKLKTLPPTADLKMWLYLQQKVQDTLLQQVSSIQHCITKIWQQWSHASPRDIV